MGKEPKKLSRVKHVRDAAGSISELNHIDHSNGGCASLWGKVKIDELL
jgi:hypothetical protein